MTPLFQVNTEILNRWWHRGGGGVNHGPRHRGTKGPKALDKTMTRGIRWFSHFPIPHKRKSQEPSYFFHYRPFTKQHSWPWPNFSLCIWSFHIWFCGVLHTHPTHQMRLWWPLFGSILFFVSHCIVIFGQIPSVVLHMFFFVTGKWWTWYIDLRRSAMEISELIVRM